MRESSSSYSIRIIIICFDRIYIWQADTCNGRYVRYVVYVCMEDVRRILSKKLGVVSENITSSVSLVASSFHGSLYRRRHVLTLKNAFYFACS